MKKEFKLYSIFLIFLTLGVLFLVFYKSSSSEIWEEIRYLDNIFDEIEDLSNTQAYYNKSEEVKDILQWTTFSKFELDNYLSNIENINNFIYPNENLYCIDIIEWNQNFNNFRIYTHFINWEILDNLEYFFQYKTIVRDYLLNNTLKNEDGLEWMLYQLDINKDLLISFYNQNKYKEFKDKIFEINGWIWNHDILTILFFEKNNLDTNAVIAFLNKCLDYNDKWTVNEENVYQIIYKYLLNQ